MHVRRPEVLDARARIKAGLVADAAPVLHRCDSASGPAIGGPAITDSHPLELGSGSGCSIQFGTKKTSAAPGSAQGLYLIVTDIEAARDALVASGIEVSEVFHPETPGASSSWATRAAARAGLHQIARATAPLQRSATRTATAGCFRT
jgi:hypothetical protein